jgi:hypothetical protein
MQHSIVEAVGVDWTASAHRLPSTTDVGVDAAAKRKESEVQFGGGGGGSVALEVSFIV